jgi:hypothetical protein
MTKWTVNELAYAKGTSEPVRQALLSMQSKLTAPWVGLTAEDLAQIESDEFWQVGNHMAIALAVEDKLKEKNT